MHLGAVLQEDQLFGGTIADNIALFESDADSARIESAARAAHIHEEIMQMPMEYRSLVGDMGSSLSGGQKQRLLLARALYRLPTILVLDEATSHLDIGKEAAVNSTIRGLNMTRVVVAHRPQTLSSMDRVWQWPIVQEESLAGARRA
jgi:ATP-binding cassette subfamily B protein RaxB